MGIGYTSVFIPSGTSILEPDVFISGKVYVCGAIKLSKIAMDRKWTPGSFLNEKFSYDKWLCELGGDLLNSDIVTGVFSDIRVGHMTKFFIRPMEDNKVFDGMVIDSEMLKIWRSDPSKKYLSELEVIASPVKAIYREYRLFVVNRKVVTGSVYKIAGRPHVSDVIEQDVIDYANSIIKKWVPSESLVMDVALSEDGFKVIEFNNINSSGFYASNVLRYVEAVQAIYA